MPYPQLFAGQRITADKLNASRKRSVVQTADQTLVGTTALVNTEIVLPIEAGAVYYYDCLISYSAVRAGSGGSALSWSWNVPPGAVLARFTQSYVRDPASGVNTGSDVILRRPATTTRIPAGGTDSTSPPINFHSAYDRGTITAGGISGLVILQVGQDTGTGPTASEVLLRGGNQTRCYFERIL
jgi:hypothetical protein